MNTQKERLSSPSNFTHIYLTLGVCVAGIIAVVGISISYKSYNQLMLGFILIGMFTVAAIYKLIFTCDAYLIDGELALQKKFRSMKRYPYHKISTVKATITRNMENITLKMENEDGSIEKYLIQAFVAPKESGIDLVSNLLLDLRNGVVR